MTTPHRTAFKSTLHIACMVLSCILVLYGPLSAHAQNGTDPDAVAGNPSANGTIEPCPLTTPTYRAWLPEPERTARVGEKVRIHVAMEPAEPPMGFYVTTLADVQAKPEGAELTVLPGFPTIALTPSAPGEYRVEIRINLIAKSSCGGVKSTQLGSDVLVLRVLQPTDD